MRFSIRDLLWLSLVVAMAVGWWIDRDRIHRQEVKLRQEVQRIQSLPRRRAEAALQVVETELAALVDINQRNPDAVSKTEIRRVEKQVEVAKLDVEMARAIEEFGPATGAPAQGKKPN